MFFSWGFFYITFGPWIESLYSFNAEYFGTYVAFIECIGNGIAMLLYLYFGSIYYSRSTDKLKKRMFYIDTDIILLIASFILFLSFLFICLLTHIISLENILYNKIAIGIVLILYFIGHEGIVIGLMILHVELTPFLQQPRASGIISMITSIMVFISQSIIIGPLSNLYSYLLKVPSKKF